MFTELMAKIDALRGQEQIAPHDLLDTLKDALGQCQSFLQQRGPVSVAINDSEYELRGQGGYKLPQHNFTGGDGQSDLSGYGSNYSFLPMFNPAMPASVNGFHHPAYGYPLMFPSGQDFEWNRADIFAPLMVSNAFSYFQLPDAWELGIDARQGVVHNALGMFVQGVAVFAPINAQNNPQANNNQVCVIAHGDVVANNFFVDNDINVNNNVNIFNDLFVGGDVDIEGNVQIDLDLNVDGDITVVNLIVTGTVTLPGNFIADLPLYGTGDEPQSFLIKTTDETLAQVTPGMLAEILANIPFYDSFTDTNGTNLEDHTPNNGVSWTSITGANHWQIDGNSTEQKATTAGRTAASSPPTGPILYLCSPTAASGTPNQISGELTFTGTIAAGELSAGFICRYADSNNMFLGYLHIDNSDNVYTYISEKSSGTWTNRSSTNRGNAQSLGFSLGGGGLSYNAGGPFYCTLQNLAGQVKFITPFGTETYTSSTNAGQKDCGIYAEVYDQIFTSGAADQVRVDNVEIRAA